MKLAENILSQLKVDESVKSQIQDLMNETIRPALNEDFNFKSKKEIEGAIKLLMSLINKLKVVEEDGDFFVE